MRQTFECEECGTRREVESARPDVRAICARCSQYMRPVVPDAYERDMRVARGATL